LLCFQLSIAHCLLGFQCGGSGGLLSSHTSGFCFSGSFLLSKPYSLDRAGGITFSFARLSRFTHSNSRRPLFDDIRIIRLRPGTKFFQRCLPGLRR
tara:strand:+ start:1131 stop:1418 length:288 start_codon:yes stop_codon:yes gene_type:complete